MKEKVIEKRLHQFLNERPASQTSARGYLIIVIFYVKTEMFPFSRSQVDSWS